MAERRGGPARPTPGERRAQRGEVSDVGVVLDAAARLLEARARSESELRRRLLRLGYQPELVEEALSRLLAVGYVDDDAFARSWVESRDRARPRGEHALRRELGQKGVDRATIETVLDDRRGDAAVRAGGDPDADPDRAAAERLLAKKLPAMLREPDPRKRRQRAYALLARNGFGPDVCSAVARAVLDQAEGDREGEVGNDTDVG